MNSIGGLIFLLIIIAQGVAAVVAGIKKRQAEAAKAQQAQQAQQSGGLQSRAGIDVGTQTPVNDRGTLVADPRSDVVSRRRRQIEELRRQAQQRVADRPARTGNATEQPTAARRPLEPTARPAQAPPRPAAPAPPQVVPLPATQQRQPVRDARPESPIFGAFDRATSRSEGRGGRTARQLAGTLRSRSKLRELVVLKEVLDRPLALRTDDSSGRT